MRAVVVASSLLIAVVAAAAPTRKYVVFVGPRAGGSETVRVDGRVRTIDFAFVDRSLGPSLHERIVVGDDGLPTAIELHGRNYEHAPVDERWSRAAGDGRLWLPRDGTPEDVAVAARALLRHGGTLPLAPSGVATLTKVETLTVDGRAVTQYEIAGGAIAPGAVWLDGDGELFATGQAILAGFERTIPTLEASESRRLRARLVQRAAAVARRPAQAVAIEHVAVFDAAARKLVRDTTVVIDGERIVAVAPRAPIPDGAERIDGRGKTLVPGLWDLHAHIGLDDGIGLVAAGVTSVRRIGGSKMTPLFDDGVLGPREVFAGVVDGKGANASPTDLLVDDAAGARAAVDTLAKRGFVQVKLYNSVPRALVPALVDEAHRRGLRISGHVPDGMKAHDLVDAGVDEIQHAYFLLLELCDEAQMTPLARFQAFARQAGAIDLSSPRVRDFIAALARKHVAADLTLVSGEQWLTTGRLPSEKPSDVERYRAAFDKTLALAAALHRAGVTLAVGTDEPPWGPTLVRELELYVRAGIPAADALQAATLGAARLMRKDGELGTIAAGKLADLVLVDGDPLADVSTLRRPRLVVTRGLLLDPARMQ